MSITGNAQNVNINSGNLILTDSSKKIRTPKIEFPDGSYLTSATGLGGSGGSVPTLEQVIDSGNTTSNTVYFSNTSNALVINNGSLHYITDIVINSSESNVRIGREAGSCNQGSYGVALGFCAGIISQSERGIAIGTEAGAMSQGIRSIAIGQEAGEVSSGSDAISIGYMAGNNTQGCQSISIGQSAGRYTQGDNAVAIGFQAGQTSQHNNTIVLNASGSPLDTDGTSRTFIKPVRSSTANLTVY